MALLIGDSSIADIPASRRNAQQNRLDIDGVSLRGVCAAHEDFRQLLSSIQGNDADSVYLRDMSNYLVSIAIVDRDNLRVSFGPAPKTADEHASGGGAVYIIDRNTGRVLQRSLDE
ncbi:MAG: hypothetical protein DCC71_15280 [Proteobacteria bacterium]|nr:MAG: hypothetical protein DCC71_15280 [Pseudomonadota bacterium]